MDDEILARREEELEALKAFYGNDLMPSLVAAQDGSTTTADNGTISPNGPWFIKLISSDNNDGGGGGGESSTTSTANNTMVPTLEIQLSPHYPLSSDQHDTPIPILHNTHGYYQPASSSEQKKQSLLQELMEMYEPDMDVAIMWAERCRQDFLDVIIVAPLVDTTATTNSNDNNNNNDIGTTENEEEEDAAYCNKQYTQTPSSNTKPSPPINETLSIMFLTYNHLLCGKSHKKEAQLVSYASKLGLHGFVVYGTPGVVGVLVSSTSSTTPTSTTATATTTTRDDVVDFAKECGKSIGKRATVLDFELQLCNDGLHPSLCMVGDGSSGGGNGGGKQSSKTKGNNSTNKKGNKDGSTILSKQNSKSKQKGNIGSLLSDLLGADRITGGGNDLSSLSILKAGLNSFSTCVELKQILVSHGLEEEIFQQILGLA